MKKLKHWLIERILPVYARAELLKENERLHSENARLQGRVDQLNAYIDGLEFGIRAQRRVVINTGEVKK